MFDLSSFKTEKLDMEKLHIHASHIINKDILRHSRMSIDQYITHHAGDLVLEIDSYIVGIADQTIEIHRAWPRDWIEALKERFLPVRLRSWWPIVYDRVDVSEKIFKAVCPHLDAPKEKFCLHFLSKHKE